jgi:hypothetical protein
VVINELVIFRFCQDIEEVGTHVIFPFIFGAFGLRGRPILS